MKGKINRRKDYRRNKDLILKILRLSRWQKILKDNKDTPSVAQGKG